MSKDFVLLTGATGQVGRYLLKELLSRRRKVAVLVRRRNGKDPQLRFADVLNEFSGSVPESSFEPICLEGDTSRNGYGLGESELAWVRQHCGMLLHCAASVDFAVRADNAVLANNIESARQTVQLFHQARLEHVAYVSTAYVCGKRTGTIYEEELDVGQAFRNKYEQSKFRAEEILRRSLDPKVLTVLRPAIVVGEATSGKSHSFHGFYRVAQFTSLLADAARQAASDVWQHNVRIATGGDSHLNLVPVDWLSEAIVEILLTPGNHGKTYHLSPRTPTTIGQIEEAMRSYFRYEGVRFTEADHYLYSGSFEEVRFYEYVKDYVEYFQNDPRFDRANTDSATRLVREPTVDVACLLRLIDFAVKCRFGKLNRRRRICRV